jgi:hypothetical protein
LAAQDSQPGCKRISAIRGRADSRATGVQWHFGLAEICVISLALAQLPMPPNTCPRRTITFWHKVTGPQAPEQDEWRLILPIECDGIT